MSNDKYIDEIAEAYESPPSDKREEMSPRASSSREIYIKSQAPAQREATAKFSDVEKDGKVNLADIYTDARAFLDKTNFSKFVIVAFTLVITPILLYLGYLDISAYKEIVLIVSLTYLGVDAYQNRYKK